MNAVKWVPKAAEWPGECVLFPHLGGAHRDGYVHTNTTRNILGRLVHEYVSVVGLKEACAAMGWPSVEEHSAALDRIVVLERELEETKAALAESDRLIEAIDVIESRDFRARKKPGRPRKDSEVV